MNEEKDFVDELSFDKGRSEFQSHVRLENDIEPESILGLTQRFFFKIVENPAEYREDFFPDYDLISQLKAANVDILAFRERSWCSSWTDMPFPRAKIYRDNVAVARFDDYGDWLTQLASETRERIKRAVQQGLEVKIVRPSVKLAKGIHEVYNEIPIRQFRRFNHFGIPLSSVIEYVLHSNNVFIGAFAWTEVKERDGLYLKNKLVGFIELECGNDTGVFSQILSFIKFRELMPNNALIAKAVEVCSDKGLNWLIYARMGNHPSLDKFKENNGFRKCNIRRAFVPLSYKGRIAMLLGLHRELGDCTPNLVKPVAVPIFNWTSRTARRFRALF